MLRYALRSWFGTFLFHDWTCDRFRHAPATRILGNLIVIIEQDGERLIEILTADADPFGSLRKAQFNCEFVTVSSHQVGLRTAGLWSATPDGFVETDRTEIKGWETFDLIPLPDLPDLTDLRNPSNFVLSQKRHIFSIPKMIHQIHLARSVNATAEAMENVAGHIERIRKSNPGYGHTLWKNKDVHDAIYEWYGYQVLEAFLRINPAYGAARADFFRYLCIYKNGGCYMDLKSGMAEPLDSILRPDDAYLLSFWEQSPAGQMGQHQELLDRFGHGEYQQWFIISQPGHPFLASVIDEVMRRIHYYTRDLVGVGPEGVWRTTGPIAYTVGIEAVIDRAPFRMIQSNEAGLVYSQGGRDPLSVRQHYSVLTNTVVL